MAWRMPFDLWRKTRLMSRNLPRLLFRNAQSTLIRWDTETKSEVEPSRACSIQHRKFVNHTNRILISIVTKKLDTKRDIFITLTPTLSAHESNHCIGDMFRKRISSGAILIILDQPIEGFVSCDPENG